MTIVNNEAPGVYVNVSAAAPSPNGNAPTGTWFVTGTPTQGPTGTAIPISSMTDYTNYLGARTSTSQTLYDSLDEFFHDGGVLAYVSRIVGPSAVPAAVVINDTASPSPVSTLTVTANGAGTWGNNVSVTIAAGSAANSYTISVINNGVVAAKSPNLFFPQDAVTWAASQAPYQVLVTIVNDGSPTSPPNNNPGVGTFALTGGVDDFADITENGWTNALTAFLASLGPGQVSGSRTHYCCWLPGARCARYRIQSCSPSRRCRQRLSGFASVTGDNCSRVLLQTQVMLPSSLLG